MDDQDPPPEVSITISASVEVLDPRTVLPPLEGDEEHPEPPAPESFKLKFVLPGCADAPPNEVQCGGEVIHIQPVDEAYIQTLITTPATFNLLREDDEPAGDYSVSLASWAMGTPKAVRAHIDDLDQQVAAADGDEEAIAALTQQRVESLAPWAIEFNWEISAEELQVLLRCHSVSNIAKLPQCKELRKVTIKLTLDRPMMTVPLEHKLNPLAITLIDVVNMPNTPLNYRQLMERCVDPFACFEFLGKKMRTPSLKHGESLSLQHTSVFFLGQMDQQTLIRTLETEPLVVELHDRDPKELQLVSDEELEEMGCKEWYYAKKAASGFDPEAPPPSGPVGCISVDLKPLIDQHEVHTLTYPALFKQAAGAVVELFDGAEPPAATDGDVESAAAQIAQLTATLESMDEKKQADDIAELTAQIEALRADCPPTVPEGEQLQVIGRDGEWLRVMPRSDEPVPHRFWDDVAAATGNFQHSGRGVELWGTKWARTVAADGAEQLQPVEVPRCQIEAKMPLVPRPPPPLDYDVDRYEKQCAPGHLIDAGTTMQLKINLLHPLQRTELKAGPVQRAVYRMEYEETDTLRQILAAVAATNLRAADRALTAAADERAAHRWAPLVQAGKAVAVEPAEEEDNSAQAAVDAVVAVLEGSTEHGVDALEEGLNQLSQIGEQPALEEWIAAVSAELSQWCAERKLASEDAASFSPSMSRELEAALVAAGMRTAEAADESQEEQQPQETEAPQQPSGGDEAAAEEEAAAEQVPQEAATNDESCRTSRTVLCNEAAGAAVGSMLRQCAAAAIDALGGPKEEVGLHSIAESLEQMRALATKLSVPRSLITQLLGTDKVEGAGEVVDGQEEAPVVELEPATGLRKIIDDLSKAMEQAAGLAAAKELAANFDHADVHRQQQEAAGAALEQAKKLAEQMDAAAFVEAAEVQVQLLEAGDESAQQLVALRELLTGQPSRQLLQRECVSCQELSSKLREAGQDEELCAAVDRLAKQILSDSRSAAVEFDTSADFISGFQVTDGEVRLLMLEGLHDGALAKEVVPVARKAKAGEELPYELMFNNKVSFKERLYAPFALDIRKNNGVSQFRLDGGDAFGGCTTLNKMLLSKVLYYRGDPKTQGRLKFGLPPPVEVNQVAYQTLNLLAELNRTTRMWDVNALSLFPTVPQMEALQKYFCLSEASEADKQGPEPPEPASTMMATLANSKTVNFGGTAKALEQTQGLTEPSWHQNPKYLQSVAEKRRKGTKDYLDQNVKATMPANPPLPQDRWWERTAEVFVYSGQKLQYTELQKESIRERAAKDKDNHYTYSQTYLSGSLCPVNEAEITQQEKTFSKSQMMSDKGFVYPAPKDNIDYVRHPMQVSAARIEDLQQPYEAPQGMGKSKREVPVVDAEVPSSLQGRSQFNATACANRLFNAPERSVHIGTDNRQFQTDNKQKMMQDWRDKVVVDDAQVHPHMGNQQVARVHQVDRLNGTLKGAPKKKALAEMPFPVEKPPMNIEVEYAPVLQAITRGQHPAQWQSPDNFMLHINSKYKPYKQKKVSGEKEGGLLQIKSGGVRIKPLQTQEKRGVLWGK